MFLFPFKKESNPPFSFFGTTCYNTPIETVQGFTMENNVTATFADKLSELPYLDMGTGFVVGMAVGYFFKKSFKIVLFLLGTAIVLLFALDQFEIIELHKEQLTQTVSTGTGYFKQFGLFLKERLSQFGFPGTGSAIAGFAVGLKMG